MGIYSPAFSDLEIRWLKFYYISNKCNRPNGYNGFESFMLTHLRSLSSFILMLSSSLYPLGEPLTFSANVLLFPLVSTLHEIVHNGSLVADRICWKSTGCYLSWGQNHRRYGEFSTCFIIVAYSELSQIHKLKLFAKIVNGFPSTVNLNSFYLKVLYAPLYCGEYESRKSK